MFGLHGDKSIHGDKSRQEKRCRTKYYVYEYTDYQTRASKITQK